MVMPRFDADLRPIPSSDSRERISFWSPERYPISGFATGWPCEPFTTRAFDTTFEVRRSSS